MFDLQEDDGSSGARPMWAGSPVIAMWHTVRWRRWRHRRACYEGAPTFPDGGRFWKICQDHGVTIFYTAPTAIRALMKLGDAIPQKYDLSKLRLLGSVGEPINPEAWMWYHRVIGGERCLIVDTWWQTETGAIMISPGAERHGDQARLVHQAAAGYRGRHRR